MSHPHRSHRRRALWTAMLLAGLLLSGCAGKAEKAARPFWPPPPGEPRIQFLASYASSTQVEEAPGFSAFVLGTKELKRRGFNKPQGVAAAGGKVFVCDSMNGEVAVLDFPNRKWTDLFGEGGRKQAFKKPLNLTTDEAGNLYVVDVGHQAVLAFDPQGRMLRAIGKEQLEKPVAVAARGEKLYVADLGAAQVAVFSAKTGERLDAFGPELEEGKRIGFPAALAFGPDGLLHVVDAATRQVLRLDIDGHLVSSLGRLGDASGTFTRPKGIAVDGENRSWVVDAAFENVQVFNAEGRILTFFGGSGINPGNLFLPTGIAITDQNLDFWQKLAEPGFRLEFVIFVTSQYGPNGLSVYGFGQKAGSG